jgi:hypothetical protein
LVSRLLALALLVVGMTARAQVDVVVGAAAGTPGATVHLPVLARADSNAVALQFDARFDATRFASRLVSSGAAATNYLADSELQTNAARRVILYSSTNAPLAEGVVVVIPFTIAADAPSGAYPVTLTNLILSSRLGDRLQPVASLSGWLLVSPAPPLLLELVLPRYQDGRFRCVAIGGPESGYVVFDASATLTDWTGVATNLAQGGVAFFSDTEARHFPHRFYRAMAAP